MTARFTKLFVILLLISSAIQAQEGGSTTFSFLNVAAPARVAAMGGTFISVRDNDLNVGLQNPALLNPSMSKFFAFSQVNYFNGISFSDVAYAQDFHKLGVFSAYIHSANYGTFKEANVIGEVTGSFKAADYAFGFGWGYQLNPLFSVGANLKGIYSDYFIESSFALATDIGGAFHDSDIMLTASIMAKNAGWQLKTYTDGNHEPLPIEIQAGVSKGFAHVPFSFDLNIRHLEKFDITYVDPNDQSNVDLITGQPAPQNVSFATKVIRHLIPGAEISISRYFLVSISYNFQRRAEMMVDTSPKTVGLSYGFGLRVSKFMLSYGHSSYHLAGASNHFSVSVNLGEIIKKKAPRETTD